MCCVQMSSALQDRGGARMDLSEKTASGVHMMNSVKLVDSGCHLCWSPEQHWGQKKWNKCSQQLKEGGIVHQGLLEEGRTVPEREGLAEMASCHATCRSMHKEEVRKDLPDIRLAHRSESIPAFQSYPLQSFLLPAKSDKARKLQLD